MVRTTWDYRHSGRGGGRAGPIAVPGKYTVEVSQMTDGNATEVIPKTEFEIESITFGDTAEINRQAILDFWKQVLKLANAVKCCDPACLRSFGTIGCY